jgi:hypothetical protein
VAEVAISPSTSKSFVYSRNRIIDCTSSESLRFSAEPNPIPPGITSTGGKSVMITTLGREKPEVVITPKMRKIVAAFNRKSIFIIWLDLE